MGWQIGMWMRWEWDGDGMRTAEGLRMGMGMGMRTGTGAGLGTGTGTARCSSQGLAGDQLLTPKGMKWLHQTATNGAGEAFLLGLSGADKDPLSHFSW